MVKHPKIKARRYWRRPNSPHLYDTKKAAQYYSGFAAAEVAPVVVLPADAASVEAMVEQIRERWADGTTPCSAKDLARAALTAIGIKPTK